MTERRANGIIRIFQMILMILSAWLFIWLGAPPGAVWIGALLLTWVLWSMIAAIIRRVHARAQRGLAGKSLQQ